jgi:hypothetical protein
MAAEGVAVAFGFAVPANALKCRIVIPASAPQTKQRCFFICQRLLAWPVPRKAFSEHVAVPATIPFVTPHKTNANLSRLFQLREPRSGI